MSAPAGDSEFAVKPIPTLIAKYSLAVMIGFTAAMLYGVIDSMFVSYFLGNQALAAVSASLPLATLTFVVPLTFSAGTATLTAIRLGEGRTDDANRILGQTVVWSALAGLSVALPCAVLLPEIFSLFGLEAGLLGQAVTFFRIALLGLPLMSVSIPLGAIIRVDGSPNIYMLTIVGTVVIVAVLNPLFIGWLQLGVAGSALANVSADLVCLAVRLAYFRSSRSRLKIAFTRPSRSVASQICRCGSAALTGQFATFAVYTAMTCLLLDLGGSDALAAGGVLERLFSLLVMPVVAISVGAQPIISYNYGSGDTGRLRRSLWSAVGLATAVSCLAMLICQLFPSSIMSLFFLRGNALTYGTDALLICTLSFPVIGLAIVGSEYFPAVYRPRVGVVLTLLRQIVFLLPLMYILSRYWQINGLWAALPLSDLLIVLITLPLLMSDLSRRSG